MVLVCVVGAVVAVGGDGDSGGGGRGGRRVCGSAGENRCQNAIQNVLDCLLRRLEAKKRILVRATAKTPSKTFWIAF